MENSLGDPYRVQRAWMNVVAKPSGEAENPTAFRPGYDRPAVNSYEWKLQAYKQAIKRHIPLVSRCSFIQQGSCHLCNATAVTLVVNVCPQFDFGHSICIKHIETVTKISVRELLDGAVFACPICTHECPCGLCDRLVAREFEFYDGWSQYHTAKLTNKSSLSATPTALPVASLATVRTLNTDAMPRRSYEAKKLSIPPKMAAKSTVRVNMSQKQPPLIDLADAKDIAPRKIAAKSLPRMSSKQQVLDAKTPAIVDNDAMLRADSKDIPALRHTAPPRQIKAAKSVLMPKPTMIEPQPTEKKPIAHHSDEEITEISAEESASTSSGSDDDEPRLKPVKLTRVRSEFSTDSSMPFQAQKSEEKDNKNTYESEAKHQSPLSAQTSTQIQASETTLVLKSAAKSHGFVNIMPKPAVMEAMEAPLRVDPNMIKSTITCLDQRNKELKRTNSNTSIKMSSKTIPSEAKTLSSEAPSITMNAHLQAKVNGNSKQSSPQIRLFFFTWLKSKFE
ncbi:hypothetical protein THRCLA_20280 [Thraustotheca clavata]|uniref:Zinc-finger domain-containing protein n=1 Tax=Thraustotheca clavata TaxID=74557 RepID=A0A1W0A951_9STRA|nr:hypothetical protein THRCLA_20280 [Thraustotheca clavata]